MTVGPVVGRARIDTNMSYDSSSLDKMGDRIAAQLSKIGQRNGRIYRNFGRDAVVSWRLALGSIVTSAPWMGAAIGAVSGAVTMLGGSLYSLAQSSFALYPVLGSVGVAAGTLAIGMRGFMDAVKATDMEALQIHLSRLAPSAQDAAVALRALKEDALDLRLSVQQRMFDGLASEIDELSNTLFPVLKKNLTDMAGVWNNLFKEMLGYTNSAEGLKTINGFLEASTDIFDKLSKAVVPFLDGAMKLFIALAPAGERLATRIADVAKSFQSWTSAEGFGDRIDAMMKRAETTGGLLLKVIGNLGGAFSNVFGAANEETNHFLETLVGLTERFKEWSGSVEGQTAIADWAADANRIMEQFGHTLESVFGVLSDLSSADAVISFLKTVEEAFDYLAKLPLSDIVAKLVELAEVFRPISGPMLAIIIAGASLNIMLGNLMGQIGGVVAIATGFPGKFSKFIGTLSGGATGAGRFSAIMKNLGKILGKGLKFTGIAGLVVWIGSLIARSDELKGKLGNVWNAIKGVFESLGEAFNRVKTALEPVITALQPFFEWLDKIASLAIGFVLDSIVFGIESIATMITGVGGIIGGFVDLIVGLFTWDTDKMMEGIRSIGTGIKDFLVGLGGTIITFFAPAKFLGWAGAAFKGLGSGIAKAMPGILKGAGNVVTGILKWIGQLPGKLLSLGGQALGNLGRMILNGVAPVGSSARAVFNIVITWIQRLPGRLLDFGKSALSKLTGAISNGVSAAKGAAGRVFDGVVNAIKNLPSRLLQFGKDALNKFRGAISDGVSSVKNVANRISTAVKDAITKLPSEMLNIGKKIVDNIADGIGRGVKKVKDAIGKVANAIKNFLPGSPVNEGPLTSWNTGDTAEGGGRNIIEAITGGLHDIRPIRRAMNDVASAVKFSMNPGVGSGGRVGSAAMVGGNSISIGNLSLNVDVDELESVPRIVTTLEGLAMKVRQGVRVEG